MVQFCLAHLLEIKDYQKRERWFTISAKIEEFVYIENQSLITVLDIEFQSLPDFWNFEGSHGWPLDKKWPLKLVL